MSKVSDADFWKIQLLRDNKFSSEEISDQLKIPPRTVRYWMKRRTPPSKTKRKAAKKNHLKLSFVEKRKKEVRKWAKLVVETWRVRYTPKRKKAVRKLFRRKPYNSPVKIARKINSEGGIDGVRVSNSTVRRDLIAMGFKAVRRPRVPPLSDADKKERVEFCRWLLRERPILVFTDEKLFNIVDHGPRHDWIEVGKGEKPMGRETPQHGGSEKLWIWGAISVGFRSFVTFEKTSITKDFYRYDVLGTVIDELKEVTNKGRKIYFMQDNARPHNGAYEWLARRGVQVLPRRWPPRSCDLNPIEQLWSLMQSAVTQRAPFSSDDLHQFIDDYVEKELNQSTIDKLCKSIFSRAARVIAAGGEIIKV